MVCYNHSDRDAVAQCNVCGKGLCKECADICEPPLCSSCGNKLAADIKAEAKKIITRSVILFVLGAAAMLVLVISASSSAGSTGSSFKETVETIYSMILFVLGGGWIIAGIPCGWKRLSKLTSGMFLFLPVIGWVLYFCIKLTIAYLIGIVILPIDIIRSIKTLKS